MKKTLSAEELARIFHDTYENFAITNKWKTQDKCQVEFDDLPEKNKQTMIDTCQHILLVLEVKKKEELANHSPQINSNKLSLNGTEDTKNDLCDNCGHKKEFHYPDCRIVEADDNYCSCKKFKAKKKGCGNLVFIYYGKPVYCGDLHKGEIELCPACSGEEK